ncbi:B12-binding domain-containing radical SAM protein [Synoicihabitans lomoniglobus]|uniref:B12-binding domain-containing radical SAM protein n=1 Tax=Synoicihabitans lomoniglobus TaxID=2909285 RepID=A0AAE9ZZL6_9BACT|nr:B12-binding domain-containing radical SAM protein [Opitutaceae bacterium LMO-M01]WED64348.1 B12-binding domain-containing radical SAM protein [Opitutaceae bacterium LMO-M01]
MKTLLLYPEFPNTFWSFKHALKFILKRASLPPLGLVTIAAMLPSSWQLRLVDLNVRRLRDQDLAWADAVCISAMIVQRPSVQALLARCRAAGKLIIAGGPLFTSAHADFPEVDHFILNEAEITLPEFLRDFANDTAKRVYATSRFADIATTPAPRWDLLELSHYGSMAVQYSRGCPFDCEFCDVTAKFGHRPRIKTPAQITTELDDLHDAGWRGQVFFVDDNLIGNKRSLARDLLPALITWQENHGRRTPFYTEASINLADDPRLMNQMVEAGFDSVFIGIETPNELALAECNKRQNQQRDLAADVHRIQRAGLQVQGGFIVGFDSDTPNIFHRQVEFIQRSGIVTAMVGLLNALPGTRLHDRLNQEGRLLGNSSGDNVDGTMNFRPTMPVEKLQAGYQWILEGIYSPKPYYQRVRTFLREYQLPRVRSPRSWRNGIGLAQATVRLGVLGRERWQYWRLLTWTLFHRPAMMQLAITLAIHGQHFRRCCDRMKAAA